MPVKYTRCDPYKNKVQYFILENELQDMSLGIVDLCTDFTHGDIGEEFRNIESSDRMYDHLILRSSSISFKNEVIDSGILKSNLKHYKSVQLLCPSNGGDHLIQLLLLAGNADELSLTLDQLCEIEIKSIISFRECLHQDEEERKYHFSLPNGLHSNGFLVFENAFKYEVDLSRISDWLIEKLGDCSYIITDTSYMLSLLQNIKILLKSRTNKELQWHIIHEYPSSEVVLREYEIVYKKIDNLEINEIVFLLSVNSSGDTAARVKQYLRPQTHAKLISIVNTNTEKDNIDIEASMCHVPLERWPIEDNGSCKQCANYDDLILVHRDTYEMSNKDQRESVDINVDKIDDPKYYSVDFWKSVDDAKAVKLHYYATYNLKESFKGNAMRHHPVYIDTERLCKEKRFRGMCIDKMRNWYANLNPDLIVVPQNTKSVMVQAFVIEALPQYKSRIVVLSIKGLEEYFRTHLGVGRVLLVDDVLITGQTIREYYNIIFQKCQPQGNIPEIYAFIILGRPSRYKDRKFWQSPFFAGKGKQPKLQFGHSIYLPFGTNECLWCQEKELLRNYQKKVTENNYETLKNRFEELSGEVTEPIMIKTEKELKTLTSKFGELNYVTIAAAVLSFASSIVNIDIEPKNGPLKMMVINYADVLDKFHEAIIPGTIIRSLEKKYFRLLEQDQRIVDFIKNKITPFSHAGLTSELALASLQGKLYSSHVKGLIENLESLEYPDDHQHFEERKILPLLLNMLNIQVGTKRA